MKPFRISNLGLIVALFASCLSSACALDRKEEPGLYTVAFREIGRYYLEPVSLESLTLAGIGGLDDIDKTLAVSEQDHVLSLSLSGEAFWTMPAPAIDDPEQWGSVVSSAIAAARRRAPSISGKSDDDVDHAVFKAMLTKLDRFSHYADAEQARTQHRTRDGFGGIGISLDYADQIPKIAVVTQNGPAFAAGIHVGDRLLMIDDTPVIHLNRDQIADRLRGPVDSRVKLLVERDARTYPVQLRRAELIGATVATDVDGDVAVFHLHGFNARSTADLTAAISDARSQIGPGFAGAVLDLRGNLGGLLDQGVGVASLFLTGGMVSTTAGRLPEALQRFPATGHDLLGGLPLVVLVDSESASSAEIVASALQDLGRAVLVGSASFGKGTVQIILPLPNAGELSLTWARLFTPAGYVLQNHGVVPVFCTIRTTDPLAQPQSVTERAASIIEHAPVVRDDASLSDDGWAMLRNQCPGAAHDPALDLPVAEMLLHDPGPYRQALRQHQG